MDQHVLLGDRSFDNLKQMLSEKGINSVFVVTGNHFKQDEGYNDRIRVLDPLRYELFIKKGVNVTIEEVDHAHTIFKKANSECILAIGGGSVMDLAKGIIYQEIKNNHLNKPLFIVVPTTAGSGSEATCIAVVYENKKKQSLENTLLQPDIAILDPGLLHSLSPNQTAISGIDAFSQAIESYWSINATMISRSFAREALFTLREYLPQAINNPTPHIREKLLWGSYLSGKAINITRTTGPHALSYYLSAYHDIPHGQAVALFLPVFLLYNSTANDDNSNHPNGAREVVLSLKELYSILQVKNSQEGFDYIRTLMKSIGLAVDFKSLGIDKSIVLGPLLDEINQQRFKNNPVIFDQEKLLKLCWQYL
jgi:alcohol dehydrogenase class IV